MGVSNRQILRGTHPQKQALGRAIAGARVARGMEQEDLAEKLGRSQEWVSRTEGGLVALSAFEYARIASVLDIPSSVLRDLAWRGIEKPKIPPRVEGK